MGHIRAFIAIPLSNSIKNYLVQLQRCIQNNHLPKISWSKPDSMHLTLKFLGNIHSSDIKIIQKIMENTVSNTHQFSLHAASIGVFPSVKKSRVIWSGIKGDTDVLIDLVKKMENQFFDHLNIGREKKRYSPHLTLARLKQTVDSPKMKNLILKLRDKKSDQFIVSNINLIHSELKSSGSVHRIIFSSYLKK